MNSAIIVAAGRGTRMGGSVEKLFLPVGGRPLVAHTWEAFERADDVHEIVLVIRESARQEFETLARDNHFIKPFKLVTGGPERQDSVWQGLLALDARCEVVLIHDGARPCVAPALITATIGAARAGGAAVAAQRVTDTIKESDGGTAIVRTVDRSRLWAVQTPQTFRVETIRRALAAVRERGMQVTDDTAACELIGQAVTLVEGYEPNPKATSPMDLSFIEMLLRARPPGPAGSGA
jgi:2-C-methyl-D-erythritol 4-phosphate cytidylyltransferase